MNPLCTFIPGRLAVPFAALLITLLPAAAGYGQMNWMFDEPPPAAADPVRQAANTTALANPQPLVGDELGLIDAHGQPSPAGVASILPEPLPASPGNSAAQAVTAEPFANSAITGEPIAGESLPLAEQTEVWYSAYPWLWFAEGWANHAELGLNATEGNTNTLSLQTGLEMKRAADYYTFAIDIDYFRTKTSGVVTQDNGRANFDYDRLLGDSPWSAFAKYGMEWNQFRPFDLRVNLNGGVGYYWMRNDETTIVSRFGAGASRELGSPIDDWVPEALFGIEAEHQITAQQKLKAKIDYFPSWSDFSDHRIVSDLAWEILLDDSENLSLKLAATNRYDSTPQGALPRDLFYSMLILYKF